MIYLFTALYCEAEIFIKRFHLEQGKNAPFGPALACTGFQQFYNEEAGICLTITGVGEIAAAAAVSAVCTAWQLHKEVPRLQDDGGRQETLECILVNVGLCAHMSGENGVFLCNKIIEQATGKTFYPDILYRHPFREEALVTGMRPYRSDVPCQNSRSTSAVREKAPAALYDMEGAAIYQAGFHFFGPHQMFFVKVVSDGGDAGAVSGEQALHLMESNQDVLSDFLINLQRLANHRGNGSHLQGQAVLVQQLAADLHCSKAMRDALAQQIHYLELAGTDYPSVIQEMYREGILPCKDKREGKLCFEELKRRLF